MRGDRHWRTARSHNAFPIAPKKLKRKKLGSLYAIGNRGEPSKRYDEDEQPDALLDPVECS